MHLGFVLYVHRIPVDLFSTLRSLVMRDSKTPKRVNNFATLNVNQLHDKQSHGFDNTLKEIIGLKPTVYVYKYRDNEYGFL